MSEELAAALAAPAEQFAQMLTWTAQEAGVLDHGDRETEIAQSGRELQRQLLESTFTIDSGCEERIEQVTSAAGIRHGTVEKGHDRGVVSVFGPVRATRMAYRNRREANLYPADARWMLPEDPYSLGMRALVAYHLAEGGYGQAQDVIQARTGEKIGPAQLAGIAAELAAWTDDFYDQRAAGADLAPAGQRRDHVPGRRQGHRDAPGVPQGRAARLMPRIRGSRRWPRSSRSPTSPPPSASPEDIAAPPARRKAHPGPQARDKWVAASITGTIDDMIGAAYDEGDRRDPPRVRQRVFLVDGNKQQITAIGDHAKASGLKVPVLIDFIHVSGYLGKAAAALHPGDPQAAREWADGQKLRVLHGRAKAVAATLASVAAKTRAKASTRHLDLADVDKAVTYLTNNHMYMKYDKALAAGWPIATGVIEGACRFVIEDRFGITGARWSPDGAEAVLKLRAVVINGDLDDYMNYYKTRYRNQIHLARYDPDSIDALGLAA